MAHKRPRAGRPGAIWAIAVGFFMLGACADSSNETKLEQQAQSSTGTSFNITPVATGLTRGAALDTSGQVWLWGCLQGHREDQCVSTTSSSLVKAPLEGNASYRNLQSFRSANQRINYVTDQDGQVWLWGDLNQGVLADDSKELEEEYTDKLTALNQPEGVAFRQVLLDPFISFGVDDAGKIWAWGYQVAGKQTNLALEREPQGLEMNRLEQPVDAVFTSLHADGGSLIALDSVGKIWAWADDEGRAIQLPSPPNTNFIAANGHGAHEDIIALDDQGNLWSWGVEGRWDDVVDPSNAFELIAIPEGTEIVQLADKTALDSEGNIWLIFSMAEASVPDANESGWFAKKIEPPVGVDFIQMRGHTSNTATHGHAISSEGDLWQWQFSDNTSETLPTDQIEWVQISNPQGAVLGYPPTAAN